MLVFFCPPGVAKPGRARNQIRERRLQTRIPWSLTWAVQVESGVHRTMPGAMPGDRPVSILCLLSGQLLAKPVTRGRRAGMCPTAAAAPLVGTGARAVAFPPPRPHTPRPAPNISAMPLVLPKLIMDLRPIRMLSFWTNQLHVKERYMAWCERELRLVGLTSTWGQPLGGRGLLGPRRSQAPSHFSFPLLPVFPHDIPRSPQ